MTAPGAREEHGFGRTVCDCALCAAPCRHIPGSLDVSDLSRLCPEGKDPFAWAEQHLRAVSDKSYPTLVPVRGPDGACHWHYGGRCAVHDLAPYGCAFFDSHMSADEANRRADATIRARREDAEARGLYFRVWRHLCGKGLTCPSGDRAGLAAEQRRILRSVERSRRRHSTS
jgi:hypothetical protein